MNRSRLPALCGLLLLALASVTAAGGEGKIKPADTPEGAIVNLNAAARAGDVASFLAQIGSPMDRFLGMEVKMARLRESFDAALTARFGKDKERPRVQPFEEDLKENFPIIEVRGKETKGDTTALTVWMYHKGWKVGDKGEKVEETRVMEDVWAAVKEGGAWKVLPKFGGSGKVEQVERAGKDGKKIKVEVRSAGAGDGKRDAEQIEYTVTIGPKFIEAAEMVLKQIKDGAFKDRKEAEQALRDAETTVRERFPPPWLKKDEKKAK